MEEGRMRRGSGAIRFGIASALFFASLSLVVWRQSRALEELRGLDEARSTRALFEAERTQLQREIQRLESRTRIVAVAATRLNMRVPSGAEVRFLREPRQEAVADAVPVRRGQLTVAEQR
jgi:cell division protein FtsL